VPKYEESWRLTKELADEANLVTAARAALLACGVQIGDSRVAVRTNEEKDYSNDFRYEVLNEARIGTAPNTLRYESVASNSKDAAGPSWLNEMSRATFESDGFKFCLERYESYSDNRVSLTATVEAADGNSAKPIFVAIDGLLRPPSESTEDRRQVQMPSRKSSWLRREIKGHGVKLLAINGLLIFVTLAIAAINVVGRVFIPPIVILAGVVLLPLYLWNCLKGILRCIRIQTSPAWRQLSSCRDRDLDSSAVQLDWELQAGATKFGRTVLLTRSWFIRRTLFSIWLCPLRNLVWVYKAETRNKTNAYYWGSDYSLVIFGRDNHSTETSLPPSELDALWSALIARAPWAIFGFSKDVAAQWRQDTSKFIAAADARYAQYWAYGAAGLRVEPLGVFRRTVHQTSIGPSS
jgi:hypothetical protein